MRNLILVNADCTYTRLFWLARRHASAVRRSSIGYGLCITQRHSKVCTVCFLEHGCFWVSLVESNVVGSRHLALHNSTQLFLYVNG